MVSTGYDTLEFDMHSAVRPKGGDTERIPGDKVTVENISQKCTPGCAIIGGWEIRGGCAIIRVIRYGSSGYSRELSSELGKQYAKKYHSLGHRGRVRGSRG